MQAAILAITWLRANTPWAQENDAMLLKAEHAIPFEDALGSWKGETIARADVGHVEDATMEAEHVG